MIYGQQLMEAGKVISFILSYSTVTGTLAIFLVAFMVYLVGIQQRFEAINKCIE